MSKRSRCDEQGKEGEPAGKRACLSLAPLEDGLALPLLVSMMASADIAMQETAWGMRTVCKALARCWEEAIGASYAVWYLPKHAAMMEALACYRAADPARPRVLGLPLPHKRWPLQSSSKDFDRCHRPLFARWTQHRFQAVRGGTDTYNPASHLVRLVHTSSSAIEYAVLHLLKETRVFLLTDALPWALVFFCYCWMGGAWRSSEHWQDHTTREAVVAWLALHIEGLPASSLKSRWWAEQTELERLGFYVWDQHPSSSWLDSADSQADEPDSVDLS